MSEVPVPVDVKSLLQNRNAMQVEELTQLKKSLSTEQVAQTRIELEALIREAEAGGTPVGQTTRAGVGAYLLGQHKIADRLLSQVTNDAAGLYVHGLVYMALEKFKEAEAKFAAAGKAGFDAIECSLKRAGAIRLQNRLDDAEQTLRSTGTEGARRAEYSYQMGAILSDRGDTYGAIEYFERAVDMDPHHTQALFRLASENALHGNDNEAVRFYEQCLSKPPYHIGALINLGLLYEDRGNYPAAAFCFRRVLSFDPEHERARMYMKDIEATQEMFFDDDSAKNEARLAQLLSRPVTDFELSVRSRNCLAGMNIMTLGDLTKVTEADLLGGKNFGETSLVEIRDLMQQHGLRVGQNLTPAKPKEGAAAWSGPGAGVGATLGFLQTPDLSPQEQAQLARPTSDLNLSVRARKCMARLGITTLGELVQRTPDELLATKNFGVTSLNEIRQQLAENGLKLRND
ncbi:MAG TPA: DNA-directed RNA polymerase subunit alpha C-terminal domain-containing protein [Planctomycetaceae bacterium]|nr:DNA-directed RNA polymerase subunit alpha C-terminal domain-containing protein [Planctomycetaceae bacterium]